MLNQENMKLMKRLEQAESKGPGGASNGNAAAELTEATKRLKKRELECQALWDTLKDLKTNDQKTFDTNQIKQVLAKRGLDSKASRKLSLAK